MRRFACAALAACVFVVLVCPAMAAGAAQPPEVSAQACVLYDPLLGEAVYEKNASQRRGMASTTKIMTAALALELYNPDDTVIIKAQWCGVEGSSMYLKAGEALLISDLLYGLMLMSGNDAAKALASIYTGDEADFVALMNDKAQELGLEDTCFENASGLDGESHYSTAMDMARMAAWALEVPGFADIVATRSAQRAGRYMTNHNRLLRTLDGAVGVKTGFTKASGRCLVSACVRQGRALIAVTLNAPDDWSDHTRLYAFGFDGLAQALLASPGVVGDVPLVSAEKSSCPLYINGSISVPLVRAEADSVSLVLCGPRLCYGQVVSGEKWGVMQARLGEKVLQEIDVFFAESIGEARQKGGFLHSIVEILREIFR